MNKPIFEKKKPKRFKNTKIIVICCVVIGVLLITSAAVYAFTSKDDKHSPSSPSLSISPSPSPVLVKTVGDTDTVALVLGVDTLGKSIRLYNADKDIAYSVYYTGSTDLKNKFDQIITAAQLNSGDIVNLSYDIADSQLYSLKQTTEYWEYDNATQPKIDTDKNILTINDINYRCSNDVVIISDGKIITLADLYTIDVMNIRGVGDRVYVIEVTAGHGTVTLINEDEFVGGSLYLDDVFASQITQDLSFVLPEGTYDISVSNGDLNGEETFEITNDSEIIFDISPYGTEILEKGLVDFIITPEGADLFVDDTYEFYPSGIELSYGEHAVEVSLGGYVTWTGIITIAKDTSVFHVSLVESSAGTTETTADGSDSDNTSDDTSSDGTTDDPDSTDGETPADSTSDDTPSDSVEDDTDDDTTDDSTDPDDSADTDDPTDSSNDTYASGSTTVTISWYPTASITIDGVYVGATDNNGELTTNLAFGEHTLYMMIGTVFSNYVITVDTENQPFSFPTSLTAEDLYSD